MLIALDEAEDGCRLIYKFQDLSEVTSGDSKKNGGSEQDVSGGSFYEAMERYQEENGKYMDLNHVKVILLGRAFPDGAGGFARDQQKHSGLCDGGCQSPDGSGG